MKPNYNIIAAIYFRSTSDVLIVDSYSNALFVDFKKSIELARDEQFMWGFEMPIGHDLGFGTNDRTITREMWYSTRSSLRKYYFELRKMEDRNEPYHIN